MSVSVSAEGVVEEASTYIGKTRRLKYMKIQVHEGLQLQKSKPYIIKVGTKTYEGETSDKGIIEIAVPNAATEATLIVDETVYDLKFVDEQPKDSIELIQTRLNNLGFDCGAIDGRWDSGCREALKFFQELHGLEASGSRTKETLDLLEKLSDQEQDALEEEEEELDSNPEMIESEIGEIEDVYDEES